MVDGGRIGQLILSGIAATLQGGYVGGSHFLNSLATPLLVYANGGAFSSLNAPVYNAADGVAELIMNAIGLGIEERGGFDDNPIARALDSVIADIDPSGLGRMEARVDVATAGGFFGGNDVVSVGDIVINVNGGGVDERRLAREVSRQIGSEIRRRR